MNFNSPRVLWTIPFVVGVLLVSLHSLAMWKEGHSSMLTGIGITHLLATSQAKSNVSCLNDPVDTSWRAPNATSVNDLTSVLNGSEVYGYIFNTSQTPSTVPYATYNWCNMPHVRAQEYVIPPSDYHLAYVEVIHRHHKRTPYQANTFPQEAYPWVCDDQSLYYYGSPSDRTAAQVVWSITQSTTNPFQPSGFPNSSCQFPQITAGGLLDSRKHGTDLFGVYHDLLGFLPTSYNGSMMQFRVTNNVITSQVASQVAVGMYPSLQGTRLPVVVQPAGVDSLEPQYTCPVAVSAYSSYGVGSKNSAWQAHLNDTTTKTLFAELDTVSGVNTSSSEWHNWFDHYFDNLSAKLCHDKPLPCNLNDPLLCINQSQADAVFRRGLYEYSYIYRDASQSLNASVASYGVWAAELASHLRNAIQSRDQVVYRHNVAHDGSISRLLSLLQVDVMVWPGMGSEVVFELWQKQSTSCWYLRVLWKGQVLRSLAFGLMDLIPVQSFFQYVDDLVGVDAAKIRDLCKL